MTETPVTRYVAVGDADVAYQVVGDGGLDLLYFYGVGSHFEHFWDMPEYAAFFARLMKFSRLILFDRRGTGGSDDVPRSDIPTWEEWTEDVRAVLDAAGSTRTAIFASGDAGPIAMLFAAMHPERVECPRPVQHHRPLPGRRRLPDRGLARGHRRDRRDGGPDLGNS